MTPDSVLITVYRAERVKAATRTPATWVLYRLVLCWPRRASLLGLLAALASIFFSFRRWASPMLSRYLCANQPATTLRGRWLIVAQLAWVAVAVLTAGVFV